MTFLAYLAASTDRPAQLLAQDLSGLADGANDIGVVVAHLRGTLGGSEAALAVEEAAYRWREWRKIKDRTQRENFVEGHFLKNFAQSEISVAVGQCRTYVKKEAAINH